MPLESLLGLPKALLGCLWTPKTLKNICFSRFLQIQLFGFLKLSMALLGSSWHLLAPIWSPNGPQNGFQNCFKVVQKMVQKTTPEKVNLNPRIGTQNGPQNGVILRRLFTLQNGPRSCFQDGSKMAPRWLKMASSSPR